MHKYVLIFALLSNAASGQIGLFINYAQWADLPAEGRVAYIMGAFDTMQIVAANDAAKKVAVHRHQCMMRAGMPAVELAENVRAFANTHSDLQNGSVQAALIGYLDDLCGLIDLGQ